LTLLAVDQTHPFPTLRCRSLNLAMLLHDLYPARRQEVLTIVQIPAVLGRLVEVSQATDGQSGFILIEDLIAMHASKLFLSFRLSGCAPFRLTRDRNNVGETTADCLAAPRAGVRWRHVGRPVRLEIASDSPEPLETFLRRALQLEQDDVYRIDVPLQLSDLSEFGNWARQKPPRRR
jgi:polyphosphate kinase